MEDTRGFILHHRVMQKETDDTRGFILHHRVMQKETDDKIEQEIVNATQLNFPRFDVCSFDKGFHRPENQLQLK